MSSRIRILDDILISKIAAGEVVERPSSVLKEFIENSLDAGAKKISVEIDSGGKRLVRVVDDGCGMSRDDAVLSVKRHSTSKITDERGLSSINTFGFRGEALPSIASVSRFSLTTRPRDEDAGTRMEIEGGKIKDMTDTGCPAGTTVEARSLFFNTRPRLKFLKTNETELSRSASVVRAAAIARPDVDFDVSHNGRNLFHFAPQSLEDRVGAVLGKTGIYPIESRGEDGIEVAGFVCSPSDGFSSMTHLYCYVNGRYVRDRFINRVVMECFGRVFDRGRYPRGALFIKISSEEVDVNVHPTKHEVRFKSPGSVVSVIRAAIESLLSTSPWITGYRRAVEKSVENFLHENDGSGGSGKHIYSRAAGGKSSGEAAYGEPQSRFSESAFDFEFSKTPTESETAGFFSNLNIVGQAGGLYIICEGEKGLVVIDQHAAHERVNFERLRNNYESNSCLKAQKLLMQEIIEMSPEDVILFGRFEPTMSKIGLKAEVFGDNAVRLESLPAILSCSSGKDLFVDILAELNETDCSELRGELDKKIDHILATMACHKSIRAGYSLGGPEIQALLSDMDRCKSPHFCPHGRPIAVKIAYRSLEKMFKRK